MQAPLEVEQSFKRPFIYHSNQGYPTPVGLVDTGFAAAKITLFKLMEGFIDAADVHTSVTYEVLCEQEWRYESQLANDFDFETLMQQ